MALATVPLFSGVIPALITPFHPDGGVNVDVVPELVQYQIDAGVSGFYVCGNTGEGFACSVDERKAMLEAVLKANRGKVPIMVHVGACPVADAVALAQHAKEVGVQAVSSVVPLDKPNNLAAAAEYFRAVGGATDLPFYVYWVAANADKSVDALQYLEAMKSVPNFKGVKFTDTNFYLFQQLRFHAPSVLGYCLNALTGPDEMALAGLVMGSDGAIGSTYNVQPRLNCALHEAFHAGDIKAAMALQDKLNVVISELIRVCDCRSRGTNIIAGLKAVYRSRGINVGPVRASAATELTAAQEDGLMAFLAGLAWKAE